MRTFRLVVRPTQQLYSRVCFNIHRHISLMGVARSCRIMIAHASMASYPSGPHIFKEYNNYNYFTDNRNIIIIFQPVDIQTRKTFYFTSKLNVLLIIIFKYVQLLSHCRYKREDMSKIVIVWGGGHFLSLI